MRAQRDQDHQTSGKTRHRTHLIYNAERPGGDVGKGKKREPEPMKEPARQHVVVENVWFTGLRWKKDH